MIIYRRSVSIPQNTLTNGIVASKGMRILGFPGGAVVKNPPANAGGAGSTHGWATKILHALWCCQKTKQNKTNLKIELPYDPAIPFLGIYWGKTLIQKDTCTPTFIAALFTIAKTWKQPKCPLTDDWIKKMWHICMYNEILLSHQKEWNKAISSNMDGPRDYHTKWSKSDRERQISYDIVYMQNLKKNKIQMNLFTNQK